MEIPRSIPEIESLLKLIVEESYPTLGAIIAISIYSVFVFIFYRALAKRDLITLNLNQYSDSLSGRLKGYSRTMIFVLQYIVVVPILITFWTLVLAIILTLLSPDADHSRNALIATSVVGAVIGDNCKLTRCLIGQSSTINRYSEISDRVIGHNEIV